MLARASLLVVVILGAMFSSRLVAETSREFVSDSTGTVVRPPSSQELPADKGSRTHTNVEMFIPKGQIVPQPPPRSFYVPETHDQPSPKSGDEEPKR